MEFAIEREAWNVYRLEDGSTVRMRVVMTRISRTGTTDNGQPIYGFDHAVLVQTEPASTQEKETS